MHHLVSPALTDLSTSHPPKQQSNKATKSDSMYNRAKGAAAAEDIDSDQMSE
jgi:hypothetical protein